MAELSEPPFPGSNCSPRAFQTIKSGPRDFAGRGAGNRPPQLVRRVSPADVCWSFVADVKLHQTMVSVDPNIEESVQP